MTRSERGSALIQVAITLLVLMALTTFVFDYGILWLSRGHAQNAADAGALAGAIARGYDDTTDPPAAGGVAYLAALRAAQANQVLGAALPDDAVQVLWDCPAWATGGGCVHVDVFRDAAHGNALPTVFGVLFGQTSQDIQATATAQAAPANASDCMRPFAIPDKWIENYPTPGPWLPTSKYDHYYLNGKNAGKPLANSDVYYPPTDAGATGFTVTQNDNGTFGGDYGQQLVLKFGNGRSDISPGWYLPVDLPRLNEPATGGDRYRENIASCNGLAVTIGDYVPTETGAKIGPTVQGVADLIAQDPAATWNAGTQTIDNSCAAIGTCSTPATISPRIVALPVFSPDEYQYAEATNDWSMCPGGGTCVHVVNVLGFFVDHIEGSDVIGYLIKDVGVMTDTSGGVPPSASFLTVIRLIR